MISHKNESFVSIIMPTYNCGEFIAESIDSVIAQTYQNWELLIADDCSNDNTKNVVKEYCKLDSRIKYKVLSENGGPAKARNAAIEMASGDYLAFLDSDDIWLPDKLKKQIEFMQTNGYDFTCTSYERVNDSFENKGVLISPYDKANYNRVLYRGDPIGNSTAVFCCKKIGKVYVPDIKKRNDFALWLKVLKKTEYVYGMQECLAKYRVRSDSVSSKKTILIKYHWYLYKEIEKLGLFKTIIAIITLLCNKSIKKITRYFKFKNKGEL